MKIKTRFAPSPTGFLHIGGARTSLYSWLYSRHNQGEFVLRVEDTDFERNSEEATQAIIEAMEWLGMGYDEGPYFQSKRMDRYAQVIDKMLEEGTAYRCYCSKEQLQADRERQEANKEKPKYVGRCRHLSAAEQDPTKPHCIRFKNPETGVVTFDDAIRGPISFNNEELDDFIIARTDGTPTYNFCVVVDDYDMGITHVIRGEDHINNTPRQINVLEAIGAQIPTYAHVSMINGPDGKKLSKRHGAVNVMQFKADGYLPEAIINYIARLGWGHGDQEIFSREELVKYFDIHSVSKNPSSFDYAKLNWLNQHYMRELSAQDLAFKVQDFANYDVNSKATAPFAQVVTLFVERCHTLKEIADQAAYIYTPVEQIDQAAGAKHLKDANVLAVLKEKLATVSEQEFTAAFVHQVMQDTAAELGLGMGKVGMPLRVAVTGQGQSPSIDAIAAFVGQGEVLARLDQAIEWIKNYQVA
ncbi:glutamate--tRNA ligase [Psittacicella melopsittaci]|uniref:Glutamate--tRNA ligase n=1 Tax=Psittacicella melopsittaci TaxID=2028576 RepID=A0A3A1YAV3_9GAMM|nr:glutamate--tRNA ligase [Psittacicella melopsittaci]RIY33247.1 glutamate--tRNA ligase [Psittacicella melopsittaci]